MRQFFDRDLVVRLVAATVSYTTLYTTILPLYEFELPMLVPTLPFAIWLSSMAAEYASKKFKKEA